MVCADASNRAIVRRSAVYGTRLTPRDNAVYIEL
jgi:hypothetical protein